MAAFEQVKRAVVNFTAAAAGDNAVVAAVAGKRIRVLGAVLAPSAVLSVKLRSAANDLTGALPLAANEKFTLPLADPDHAGWVATNSGEALNVNVSAAGTVTGFVVYQEVS